MVKQIIKSDKGFLLGKRKFKEGVIEVVEGKHGTSYVFKSDTYVENLKESQYKELLKYGSQEITEPKKRGRKKKVEEGNQSEESLPNEQEDMNVN